MDEILLSLTFTYLLSFASCLLKTLFLILVALNSVEVNNDEQFLEKVPYIMLTM